MSSQLTDQPELNISPQEAVLLQNQESLHLVELYLKRSRFAVFHSFLLYLFVAYCFYGTAETSHIVAWLIYILAIDMLVLLQVNSYDTNQITDVESKNYKHRQILLHLFSGSVWSVAGFLLINDSTPIILVYLFFTISAALISLGVSIMSPSMLGLTAYTLSTASFTVYYTWQHFDKLNLFFFGAIGLIITVMQMGYDAHKQYKRYIKVLMLNNFMNNKLNANNQVLNQHANVDELTGLHNRRFILEDYYSKVSAAKRYQQPLSILLIDIDYFKKVNDQYGHPIGDEVLMSVALDLAHGLRESDLIGRYGGEEFLALLPMTDLIEAQTIAERLRAQVANSATFQEKYGFIVTVSIGLAELSLNETELELISRVDKALYAAKNNGRNRVELSSNIQL
jgi:diguanylate cyclase (GGDEF)-like protein